MRIGVIGCGYWGPKHLRVMSEIPGVTQLVAIDGSAEALRQVVSDLPGVLTRPTLTTALDEIDAVVVATPPASHAELATEALEAGKHVLIEKPMTANSTEANALVDLADRTGLVLAVGHVFAHNDAVRRLESIIGSGRLGRLHYLDSARLSLGLYRSDVNVLWDLAAHDISISNLLVGAVPDTVSAWGDRHTHGFGVDVAALRLWYDRPQVAATIRVSWLDPDRVRRTTVVGSEKMAVYDDTDPDARIRVLDRGRRLRARLGSNRPPEISYRDQSTQIPDFPFREPLKVQARDFLRACLTEDGPKVDGRAGLAVVAVLEAADRSLEEHGAPIPIDLGGVDGRSLAAA